MKKVLTLLICLCLVSGMTALADGVYVFDEAGILSDGGLAELDALAADTVEKYGCGVYIVTVDDYTDIDPAGVFEAAMDIYLDRGFAEDGVMLLLSMNDRDYSFIVHGDYAEAVFTDYAREHICEDFLDEFRYDGWYNGFADFICGCGAALDLAINGSPEYDDGGEWYYPDDEWDEWDYYEPYREAPSHGKRILISAAASAVIALIVCLVLKGRLRSVKPERGADEYAVNGSFELHGRSDVYTHTTVTRVRHDNDSNNNMHHGGGASFGGVHSGGGGFSGTSGKF